MGLLMGLDSLSSEVMSVKEYVMAFVPAIESVVRRIV